jgi:YVTN family beta-propeller protein
MKKLVNTAALLIARRTAARFQSRDREGAVGHSLTTLCLMTILAVAAAFGAEGYKVVNKFKIGGTGGWDYVTVDSAGRRVYASHGTIVEVLDADSGKVVGQVTQLHGVHGIAVAPDLGKGFISNGQSNSVTVFDLKTLAKTGEPATGQNPDSICYDPKTRRVFTFNGRSNDATAIDAKTNEIVKSFPVGEKPEFCVVDGAGKIYVNLENTSEIVEIDAAKPDVTRRAPLAPCEGPSGLAIDVKNKKLFSVCGNKMMAVTDIGTLKVIATPPIGPGTDGAGFDPGTGLAFSANGGDATLTIVKPVNGKYEAVDNVPTERGARTMAVDGKTHHVYLLAAEYGPAPESKPGQKKARPPVKPDTFHVLVVGK